MLHFTSRAEWEAAETTGEYRPAAMAKDGFVHLSFGHQLARCQRRPNTDPLAPGEN
jgi:uncharacterized protein (DUF952 family)